MGGLPVFSRKWGMENGKPKRFDQVVMDIPIGSGPYRIGPVRFGKKIGDGTPDEVRNNPEVISAYLGTSH